MSLSAYVWIIWKSLKKNNSTFPQTILLFLCYLYKISFLFYIYFIFISHISPTFHQYLSGPFLQWRMPVQQSWGENRIPRKEKFNPRPKSPRGGFPGLLPRGRVKIGAGGPGGYIRILPWRTPTIPPPSKKPAPQISPRSGPPPIILFLFHIFKKMHIQISI